MERVSSLLGGVSVSVTHRISLYNTLQMFPNRRLARNQENEFLQETNFLDIEGKLGDKPEGKST